MTVTRVEKDYDNLSLTLIAEFEATIEAVWQLWEDPRKLERWWGPPSHPATVHRHELRVGGEVTYSMAGASGGWWRITAVEPPRALEFTDGWTGRDAPTTDVRRCSALPATSSMPPPWLSTISLRSIHAVASSRRIAGSSALLRHAMSCAKTVAVQLGEPGEARKRLRDAGLTITALGDQVQVANVQFGSRARKSGFEAGWDIAAVKVPTERPSPYWVYIPATLLVALVWFGQGRRQTAPRGRQALVR